MGIYAFRRRKNHNNVTKSETLTPQPKIVNMTVKELKEIAKNENIDGYSEMKKSELIEALQQ